MIPFYQRSYSCQEKYSVCNRALLFCIKQKFYAKLVAFCFIWFRIPGTIDEFPAKKSVSMKCVAVSDIHLKNVKTEEADLLLVAGDMTMMGTESQLEWYKDWLRSQPQKYKVWIAGNHDCGLESNPEKAYQIARDTDSIYLDDSEIELDGVRIWGSPVQPEFHNWAFNRQRGHEINQHWKKIPENLDILLTHGPPFGHHDEVENEKVGCEELLNTIKNILLHPPRYHIFGHIHEGYGRSLLEREDGKKIELINASSCDRRYQPVNPPIVFEV